MGNRRNKRSRRLETSSPDKALVEAHAETTNQGNETLTSDNTVHQETLGNYKLGSQLFEPLNLVKLATRSRRGPNPLNKRIMTG